MNNVVLIGRLCREPELREGGKVSVCRFTLAVDRMKKDDGADFIPVVAFGKSAELCQKYLHKGMKTAVEGRVQTGSYENKEGQKVYTTDVIANRIEFIEWGDSDGGKQRQSSRKQEDVYSGFDTVTDDVPF